MSQFTKFLCAMVLACLLSVTGAWAGLTLTSTGTVVYTFTTYDGSAAPSDWAISASGGALVYQGLDKGTGQSAGVRAYTNNTPSVNRALGFLGTTTVTNFVADLVVSNNTGVTLTGLTLSFDVLQYRVANNGRVSSLSFTDVAGLGLTGQSFSSTTNPATGFQDPPLATGSYIQTLTGLSILNGDTFTFRWDYKSGGPSGFSQGLALDNVSLTVIPEPSTVALVGLGLLGAVLIRRRR